MNEALRNDMNQLESLKQVVATMTGATNDEISMNDKIHALVWAMDSDPEAKTLVHMIAEYEKIITKLEKQVTDLEALAEERRKSISKWATQWLEDFLERCDEDSDFFDAMRPSLQKVYDAILSKRKNK